MEFIDCYDEERFERFATQIVKMFATARKRSSPLDHARLIKPRDRVALMQTGTVNQTIAIITQEEVT